MLAEKLSDGHRKYLPKEIMYEEIVDTFGVPLINWTHKSFNFGPIS